MTPTDAFPAVPHALSVRLIVIGDEILSGKRADKHMSKTIELLRARGMALTAAHYLGDVRIAITAALTEALDWARDTAGVVLCTGGIGATPDDHTRQCAAAALGVPLALHDGARLLILERMRDMALANQHAFEPDRADNQHRLKMGEFPSGARLVPNPYNKIPGFFIARDATALAVGGPGCVYFLPGFPVMAWPMIEWVLDEHLRGWHRTQVQYERACIVLGAMEATLTPLMEQIEAAFAGVQVFSLPSVDHPEFGRCIELGVKGADEAVVLNAYSALKAGIAPLQGEVHAEIAPK
jgi:molybdopterin-biosynthesis enzyme MoeA-like protein